MFLRREHLAALVVAVSLAANAQPSYAQWAANGVPLCAAAYDQYYPTIATDGAGGAIVTWVDYRSGRYDIYTQHVLASGAVDPVWTAANGNANGTPLCTAAPGQSYPKIITDGAGGAIVTWNDGRGGGTNADIYAQHVLSTGAVDPAWPADGLGVCTAAANQYYPTIVTDGAGGAIITWQDERDNPGTGYYQIYAQHVLASGTVDPAWSVDGSRLPAGGSESGPMIVTDVAGGAIVTWTNAGGAGIYAQHVLASGTVDSVWTNANGNANGTPLCTATGRQDSPEIVTDGSGGAIVTWMDGRSNNHIYAQRVNAAGVVQWIPDGTPVCTAAGEQRTPTIATDMAGGAIVTWMDFRNGTGYDIYAQRVLASGGVDPAWPADGRGLTAAGGAGAQTIVTDMAGGAIVTWYDNRTGAIGGEDIYAQHMLASGTVDPTWPVNGFGVCTAGNYQRYPEIVADMAGGAIVTWMDNRSSNMDIYAQRISGSGGVSAVATGGPSYSFAVQAPHPNPANSQATISFDLASPRRVSVRVFDVTGRLVRTLAAGGELPAGGHSLMWNGASDSGTLVHAGIYFIRVSVGSAVRTRRVAIIR